MVSHARRQESFVLQSGENQSLQLSFSKGRCCYSSDPIPLWSESDSHWGSFDTKITIVTIESLLVENSALPRTRNHLPSLREHKILMLKRAPCVQRIRRWSSGVIRSSLVRTALVPSPWRHKSPLWDAQWCDGRKNTWGDWLSLLR